MQSKVMHMCTVRVYMCAVYILRQTVIEPLDRMCWAQSTCTLHTAQVHEVRWHCNRLHSS